MKLSRFKRRYLCVVTALLPLFSGVVWGGFWVRAAGGVDDFYTDGALLLLCGAAGTLLNLLRCISIGKLGCWFIACISCLYWNQLLPMAFFFGWSEGRSRRHGSGNFISGMMAGVLFGAIQTIIPKLFALSDTVTDEHSFYLMTNVLMLLSALSYFALLSVKSKENFKDSLVIFEPKRLAPTVLNVVSNNVSSLVLIPILATVNLSVYTPVSSAYGVVVSVAASLCFREKLGIYSYLGAAVAILAMII